MGRKSELEGPLPAIFDGKRSGRSLIRLGVLLAVILIAGLVGPVSIVKATAPEKQATGKSR